MGLLKALRRRLSAGGLVLLETYGSADRTLEASAAIHVCEAGEVYAAMTTCTGASPPRACAAWPTTPATRASSCSTPRSSTVIRASSEPCAPAHAPAASTGSERRNLENGADSFHASETRTLAADSGGFSNSVPLVRFDRIPSISSRRAPRS